MPALSPAYAQRELSLAAAMVGAGTLGLQRATEFAKCKRGEAPGVKPGRRGVSSTCYGFQPYRLQVTEH